MILALDKYRALSVFHSIEDAARHLEAIDVQQDAFEFCDEHGQRYVPFYVRTPKQKFGLIDIGSFKLMPQDTPESGLTLQFLERADRLEHSDVISIASLESLRQNVLNKPK